MDTVRTARLMGGLSLLLSLPAYAQVEYASRTAGVVQSSSAPAPDTVFSPSATLTQDFEGTFPPTGWLVRNQSTTIGTNTNCWNQFTATPWAPHGGSAHTGANFNCTT